MQNRLGTALLSARKSRGWSQEDLAARASLSSPTIRNLERSRGNLASWYTALNVLGLMVVAPQLPPGAHLGQQIAALRKRRGLSQRALCEVACTTQPTLIRLEAGLSGRLSTLERVLTALGAAAVLVPPDTPRRFYTQTAATSSYHGWGTPPWVLRKLYRVFGGFDLDPCSPTANRRAAAVRARVHFTPDDDGLTLAWFGTVFVNPPYGRSISRWTHKARSEVEVGNAQTVVALVPARTDTKWWHRDLAGRAHIWFLKGRLRFGDAAESAPFPSALVVWGLADGEADAVSEQFPDAWPAMPGVMTAV